MTRGITIHTDSARTAYEAGNAIKTNFRDVDVQLNGPELKAKARHSVKGWTQAVIGMEARAREKGFRTRRTGTWTS